MTNPERSRESLSDMKIMVQNLNEAAAHFRSLDSREEGDDATPIATRRDILSNSAAMGQAFVALSLLKQYLPSQGDKKKEIHDTAKAFKKLHATGINNIENITQNITDPDLQRAFSIEGVANFLRSLSEHIQTQEDTKKGVNSVLA